MIETRSKSSTDRIGGRRYSADRALPVQLPVKRAGSVRRSGEFYLKEVRLATIAQLGLEHVDSRD